MFQDDPGGLVVAILTDPGGPVLPAQVAQGTLAMAGELRSSPTLEGRCCARPRPS